MNQEKMEINIGIRINNMVNIIIMIEINKGIMLLEFMEVAEMVKILISYNYNHQTYKNIPLHMLIH